MNRNYPNEWGEYGVRKNCISGGREYGIKTFKIYLVRVCIGMWYG